MGSVANTQLRRGVGIGPLAGPFSRLLLPAAQQPPMPEDVDGFLKVPLHLLLLSWKKVQSVPAAAQCKPRPGCGLRAAWPGRGGLGLQPLGRAAYAHLCRAEARAGGDKVSRREATPPVLLTSAL